MKEFILIKKIKKLIAKQYKVNMTDVVVNDIDISEKFNNCIEVNYSYPSPLSLEYVNGKRMIDLNVL